MNISLSQQRQHDNFLLHNNNESTDPSKYLIENGVLHNQQIQEPTFDKSYDKHLNTLILPSTLDTCPTWLTPALLDSIQLTISIKPESIKNKTVDLSWIKERNITVLIDNADLTGIRTINVGESTNVEIVVQGQLDSTAQEHTINVQKQDTRNKKEAYYDLPPPHINYNCEIYFKDNQEEILIECPDFAIAWITERQLQIKKETNTANATETSGQKPKFAKKWKETTGSKENIQQKITSDTKHQYDEIRYKAKKNYLVGHGKASWEGFLNTLFMKMEEDKCRAKWMLMGSGNHEMALELQVKQNAYQKTEYWISFYDANATQVQEHISYQPNNQGETLSIIDQLISTRKQDAYYGKNGTENYETVSMLHVARSINKAGEEMLDNENRSTEYFIEKKPIDASGVHALLRANLSDMLPIKRAIQVIKDDTTKTVQQKQAAIMQLLSGKNAESIPGLYMALQNGHHEAIAAFGEILHEVCTTLVDGQPLLTSDQLVELLSAKSKDGIPGLYIALQSGHHEAIRIWGEILLKACSTLVEDKPLLTLDQLAKLLNAKDADGTPGLYMALQSGHHEAIAAFGKILLKACTTLVDGQPLLTLDQLAKLLSAKDADDTPGIFMALNTGHHKAIAAFCNILLKACSNFVQDISLLTSDQIATLLSDEKKDGTIRDCVQLYCGGANAVGALMAIIKRLQEGSKNNNQIK